MKTLRKIERKRERKRERGERESVWVNEEYKWLEAKLVYILWIPLLGPVTHEVSGLFFISTVSLKVE